MQAFGIAVKAADIHCAAMLFNPLRTVLYIDESHPLFSFLLFNCLITEQRRYAFAMQITSPQAVGSNLHSFFPLFGELQTKGLNL